MTILNNKKQFESYPENDQKIKDIYPEHANNQYTFTSGCYHNKPVHSILQLFLSGNFTRFHVQGSSSFHHIVNCTEKEFSILITQKNYAFKKLSKSKTTRTTPIQQSTANIVQSNLSHQSTRN